jgi:chemotaxis response regulator CheB
MTRIRILLVGLPPLLSDILGEAFARETDVEVVASDAPRADMESLVRETRPDVVVSGVAAIDATAAGEIRRIAPSALVIAIAVNGDRATLYGGSTPLEITDLSINLLLRTIRAHCAEKDNTRLPPA